MSKRLQVVMQDDELSEIPTLARRQNMSVAEWVRQALRTARQSQPNTGAQRKLEAIRLAIRYDYPTADIDLMLGEIESGYGVE